MDAEGEAMKVQYEFIDSGLRGKKVRVFREVGTTDWRTFTKAAKLVGRDNAAVRESVMAGRPITVPSKHFYVIGGPCDGMWVSFTTLSKATGASPSHCRRLADAETATIKWRSPNRAMVRRGKKGAARRSDKGLTARANLDGVCRVLSVFNSMQMGA